MTVELKSAGDVILHMIEQSAQANITPLRPAMTLEQMFARAEHEGLQIDVDKPIWSPVPARYRARIKRNVGNTHVWHNGYGMTATEACENCLREAGLSETHHGN